MMLQRKTYKLLEAVLIFIVIPFSFLYDYSVWVKIGIAIFGFIYIVWMLLRVEKQKFALSKSIRWNAFWQLLLKRSALIIVFTLGYMFLVAPEGLFSVILNKPILWIIIVIIYSLTSVYPQELIYRTFFDIRYRKYFKNRWLFIFINALVFSFAHIIFWNTLVLVLTFIGGLFFAITYEKTKSTVLVSIEHAIYGSWLFTIGMGAMLGFPQ
jgi:membrane protease YdiL (CAAX protease family)